MANYHVVPADDGWAAKREGASQASSKHGTQVEAERAAKQYSGNSGGGEVRIHRPDGTIRDSDTVPPGHESSVRDTRH
ncbi:MAG: DUF2188 domain-containing protein [Solirubrobacterales bacterium]